MQALVLPLRKLAEHKKKLAHFKLVASCESPNDCKALCLGEKKPHSDSTWGLKAEEHVNLYGYSLEKQRIATSTCSLTSAFPLQS